MSADPIPTVWRIRVPLEKNPLSLNSRMHWRPRAQLTRRWRMYAYIEATALHIPNLERCDVTLTHYVRDKRRRDEDNYFPLLKALCDGLVDAGFVRDDTPDLMGKACRIERAPEGEPVAYMELRIAGTTKDETR